jgi:hypothetical protein
MIEATQTGCWHRRLAPVCRDPRVAGVGENEDLMGAVLLWTGAELRARWKAVLGLALVLGLTGGVVTAAAAGARRTASVYDRMLVAQGAPDVTITDDGTQAISVPLSKVIELPQVASYVKSSFIFYVIGNQAAVAATDARLGRTVNRWKVLSGRMYSDDAVDEVVVGFGVARRLALRPGSTFPLIEPQFLERAKQEGVANRTMHVVGIVAGPGEFPPQYVGSYPSIHFTPAFFRTYGNRLSSGDSNVEHGSLFVDLRHGVDDLPAFLSALERLAPDQAFLPQTSAQIGAPAKRSFHLQASGLWILAAFSAITLLLIAGQALARQAFIGSSDFPTLRAIGFRPGGLALIGIARAAIVGIAAAAVASIIAIMLSPLAPAGDARIAEPHPGLSFDGVAIVTGAGALLLATIILGSIPAWRASRVRGAIGTADIDSQLRPSRVASAFAAASLPAPAVAGARLALETGRGRTAVPVRSTLAGAAFGLAVLIAAITFGASLTHLVDTPALYGVGWDAYFTNYKEGPDLTKKVPDFLSVNGLAGVTIAGVLPVQIRGKQVFAFGVMPVRGRVGPPIVSGRAPAGPAEIALAAQTMRRAGASIGSTISLRVPVGAAPSTTYTVVGRTVIPPSGIVVSDPGEGALMRFDGLLRLVPPEARGQFTLASDALVRFSHGADRNEVILSLAPVFGQAPAEFGELPPETPEDIVSFGQVKNLPLVLGLIIGLIAAATLAHTVASSVRRRRGDIAILKTLGFVRSQVRATVACQATVLILAALIVGVPAGIAIGRVTWLAFADQIGVVPAARSAMGATLLIIPAGIILANVIAAIPGGAAARIRPAAVLRAQ